MFLSDKIDRLFDTSQDQCKEAIATIAKEIAKIQINNKINSSNDAMNSYFIYQWVYRRKQGKEGPSRSVTKKVRELWKKEPERVKDVYRDISKMVKEIIKGTTTHFIESKYSSQADRNAKNDSKHSNIETLLPVVFLDFNGQPLKNDFTDILRMDNEEFNDFLGPEAASTYNAFLDEIENLLK